MLKKTGVSSIITSIVFAIIGIILMINPKATVTVLINVVGAVFIAFGVICLISYFIAKDKTDIYSNNLLYGIVGVVLGIIVIIGSNLIGNILRVAIGCWIIYSGIVRLSFALRLKKMEITIWKSVAFIAGIILVCGLVILLHAGAIFEAIGFIILVYAIMDLLESIIFLRKVDEIF